VSCQFHATDTGKSQAATQYPSTAERKCGTHFGTGGRGSAGATFFHSVVPAVIRNYGMQYPDVIRAPRASSTALLIARLGAVIFAERAAPREWRQSRRLLALSGIAFI
jgi:hypothetical protein